MSRKKEWARRKREEETRESHLRKLTDFDPPLRRALQVREPTQSVRVLNALINDGLTTEARVRAAIKDRSILRIPNLGKMGVRFLCERLEMPVPGYAASPTPLSDELMKEARALLKKGGYTPQQLYRVALALIRDVRE